MAQVTNFFLGANSGSGFQNLFSEILDVNDTFDLMILKGGPGVGKNTFMREIGRTMEAAGADVEYLWCSGDPDSLDGVVIPSIRCGVCDGTSPHVMEPRFPAAVDRYVDLGRFYDISAAKAQRIRQMSKGTREKVQLIMVMSRSAKLYLLDEPIGGVDPATRDYILTTIISNYNPEASVILSTHLIADVEKVLDEVVFIDKGHLVLQSSVDQIREEKGMSVDALFREVFKC